ncbi:hypothetical protein [Streptomyces sp. NPDC003480]
MRQPGSTFGVALLGSVFLARGAGAASAAVAGLPVAIGAAAALMTSGPHGAGRRRAARRALLPPG